MRVISNVWIREWKILLMGRGRPAPTFHRDANVFLQTPLLHKLRGYAYKRFLFEHRVTTLLVVFRLKTS